MLSAARFAILPKSGQSTPLISYTSTEELSIWFQFCLHCFSLKSLLQHSSCFGYHIFPASFLPVSAQTRTGNLKFTGWRQEEVGEYRSVLIWIYSESKKHHFHIKCDKDSWKVISAVQRLYNHKKMCTVVIIFV